MIKKMRKNQLFFGHESKFDVFRKLAEKNLNVQSCKVKI